MSEGKPGLEDEINLCICRSAVDGVSSDEINLLNLYCLVCISCLLATSRICYRGGGS